MMITVVIIQPYCVGGLNLPLNDDHGSNHYTFTRNRVSDLSESGNKKPIAASAAEGLLRLNPLLNDDHGSNHYTFTRRRVSDLG